MHFACLNMHLACLSMHLACLHVHVACLNMHFAFLAEDNQFVCKGDVIGDYVNLIQELGQDSHMINLAGMQCYKYAKDNNRYQSSKFYRKRKKNYL